MSENHVQSNSGDEKKVNDAKNRERSKRDRELNDLRYLLQSHQGRRFVWRLLAHCSVFESIWSASALIHKNSGRQDVGHFLMAEVTAANEEAFFQMMKEAKQGEM